MRHTCSHGLADGLLKAAFTELLPAPTQGHRYLSGQPALPPGGLDESGERLRGRRMLWINFDERQTLAESRGVARQRGRDGRTCGRLPEQPIPGDARWEGSKLFIHQRELAEGRQRKVDLAPPEEVAISDGEPHGLTREELLGHVLGWRRPSNQGGHERGT